LRNAYGDRCLGRTQYYDWLEDGRESVDGDPRLGRPSTSTDDARVTKVNETERSNRRLTVREIATISRQKSNHHSGLVNFLQDQKKFNRLFILKIAQYTRLVYFKRAQLMVR